MIHSSEEKLVENCRGKRIYRFDIVEAWKIIVDLYIDSSLVDRPFGTIIPNASLSCLDSDN